MTGLIAELAKRPRGRPRKHPPGPERQRGGQPGNRNRWRHGRYSARGRSDRATLRADVRAFEFLIAEAWLWHACDLSSEDFAKGTNTVAVSPMDAVGSPNRGTVARPTRRPSELSTARTAACSVGRYRSDRPPLRRRPVPVDRRSARAAARWRRRLPVLSLGPPHLSRDNIGDIILDTCNEEPYVCCIRS